MLHKKDTAPYVVSEERGEGDSLSACLATVVQALAIPVIVLEEEEAGDDFPAVLIVSARHLPATLERARRTLERLAA